MTILLSAATTQAAGSSTTLSYKGNKSFQATGTTSAGAGSATIQVHGSHDNSNWLTLGTITLTLSTTPATDGFTSFDRFNYFRGNVTAISGTGASVNLYAEV